ncbi:hypothetical protein EJ04DRAFT_582264 [Polyplosphaeria fusca]|uniref:Calcineurin-like phosphoesterase domain-containing protein n=1 Tax=Polyplosphaeria fusca TaxID=682080 RepID=A0A9P4QGZ4_9PLEO|nr:hypothetical protein EJ04DRAFT_582264 [Polyplosphaeria fusca]
MGPFKKVRETFIKSLTRRTHIFFGRITPITVPSWPMCILVAGDINATVNSSIDAHILIHVGHLSPTVLDNQRLRGGAVKFFMQRTWSHKSVCPRYVVGGQHESWLYEGNTEHEGVEWNVREGTLRYVFQKEHITTCRSVGYLLSRFRPVRVICDPALPVDDEDWQEHFGMPQCYPASADDGRWNHMPTQGPTQILITRMAPKYYDDYLEGEAISKGSQGLLKMLWSTKPSLLVVGHDQSRPEVFVLRYDSAQRAFERSCGRGTGGLLNMPAWRDLFIVIAGGIRNFFSATLGQDTDKARTLLVTGGIKLRPVYI